MSKKPNDRVIRYEIFGDDLKRANEISEIKFIDGQLKCFSKSGEEIQQSAKYKIGYTGNTKFKSDIVIHRENINIELEPLKFLLEFDNIYFIDTNHKNGVSVSVVIALFRTSDKKQVIYNKKPAYMFFKSSIEQSEKKAITELIQFLVRNHGTPPKGIKVAIINDSNLGDMDNINKRVKPLCQDFYLPDGFELIYASADHGSTHINKIFKFCDKLATETMNSIASLELTPENQNVLHKCEDLVFWINEDEELVIPEVQIGE